MNIFFALAVAATTVNAFVTVSQILISASLPSDRTHAHFAFASVGMTAYALGSVWLQSASDPRGGFAAQQLQFVGVAFALIGYARLIRCLQRPPWPAPYLIAELWAGGATALVLTGVTLDPGDLSHLAHGSWRAYRAYPEAPMTPMGVVFSVGSALLAIWVLADMSRHRKEDPTSLHIIIASVPTILAWFFDTAARIIPLATIRLTELVYIGTSLGVSYVLLGRFVRNADDLESRTNQLRRSMDELREVQSGLIRSEQLAAVGELSGVVAHELQYPLDRQGAALSRLRDDPPEEERKAALDQLEEETHHLNDLIRDLLIYARPVDPQARPLEISTLIEGVMSRVDKHAGRNLVNVRVDIKDAPAELRGDVNLLEQALTKVVESSLHAMPEGGVLEISVAEEPLLDAPGVALTVRDTGAPREAPVLHRARASLLSNEAGGANLGLAIVHRIVQAHGGRMEIVSRTDGTIVTLRLPAT